MVERLGVGRETIDWEMLKEYENHRWDGDVNPLKTICDYLAEGHWVAVESGVSTGKTYLAACLTLWFLDCFPQSRVVTIAPKADQLKLHIWSEIGELHPKFGKGELQTFILKMRPPKDYWAAVGFVAGVSAEEASASARKAQGFHRANQLIIFEETPGIHEAVITAFENTSTAPNNLILALGNPDHQQDALHKFSQRRRVKHVRISGFDHPNVVLKNPNFVPGAQTEEGLANLLDKYKSEDNMLYRSRARGISPQQATDALIRWEWCVGAANRGLDDSKTRIDNQESGALGVDVANSEAGDKAAIARGQGATCLEVDDFPCPNNLDLGADVFTKMKLFGISPENVGVDGVGVGAGTVNKINELLAGSGEVVNIQSGAAATEQSEGELQMQEKFKNLRSQMWWQARTDLQFGGKSGLVLPDDEELFADLCAPKFRVDGKVIIVESKEAIKKRLGRSPNKGDAFVYWNWIRKNRATQAAIAVDDQEGEIGYDPFKARRSGRGVFS
ncbi:MAG: hypothetical protein O7D34_00360 [Ignavibacteria bacterium]|nr:hypothetical protein [Ignavibacteria bacterium]